MKKKRIIKGILIIALSLIIIGVSYIGSLYIDKWYQGREKVAINVTFDDAKTYTIPTNKKLTQEEALKTWPYMFTIENTENGTGLYQLIIKDVSDSTITRDKLNYLLLMDEDKIGGGSLAKITNDVLYEGKITKHQSQRFKLYIWAMDDVQKSDTYTYQITLNAIKDKGPGF